MNHSKNTIERFSFIKEGKKLDIDSLQDKLKFSRSGKKIEIIAIYLKIRPK